MIPQLQSRMGKVDPKILDDALTSPKRGEALKITRDAQGREYFDPPPPKPTTEKWDAILLAGGLVNGLPQLDKLDDFQRSIYDQLVGGVKNAVLTGDARTGKTSLLLLALHHLYMSGRTVMMARMSEYKSQCEPGWRDQTGESEYGVIQRYARPDVLVLDEVGYGNARRQMASDHEIKVLLDLVSKRCAAGRLTWVSTNQSMSDLEAIYDAPIIHRLAEPGASVVASFAGKTNYAMRTRTK